MIRTIKRILLLTLFLIAGTAAAMWLVWQLPATAILALAAGMIAILAAAGIWRLWIR
jgi:hypothetical protein